MGWGVTLKDCQLKMGGAMVSRGTAVAHKLSGTESSPTSSEILCKGQEECQHFGEDRQHISQSIHQSLWGDAFLSNECPDDGDMEMVPRQTSFNSRGSARSGKSHHRWGILDTTRPLWLDNAPPHINNTVGPLKVDLFASHLTHKLPHYFSWKRNPAAEATDAFT